MILKTLPVPFIFKVNACFRRPFQSSLQILHLAQQKKEEKEGPLFKAKKLPLYAERKKEITKESSSSQTTKTDC